MQQASSPVLQQQLRALHPAIHSIHHSPDGSLYPQTLPELQNLHPSNAVFQHQPYALEGPSQPPHGLPVHFEQHALPQSQFASFPPGYQQTASPRFALNAPPLPPTAQQFHASHPSPTRPPQPPSLPPPPPVLATPQPLPARVEHVQSPVKPQAQIRHEYVAVLNTWGALYCH